ncbi:DNA ligase (plasmid) [Mycobacterium sp. smrl_JER01]|uniref:ATP-dependent DNA ligase n=1 Tax=Mycobacteriaceae TaxID=1762 RepID=UPI003AC2BF4A
MHNESRQSQHPRRTHPSTSAPCRARLSATHDAAQENITSTFPELAKINEVTGGQRLLLDGEIVALDQLGRPSFSRLQQRWPMRRRPTRSLLEQVPVMFFAFDLLASGNDDLTDRPYVERRQMLSALPQGYPLMIPPYWDDAKPVDMLAAAAENGVEGVVAKRLNSPYVSGRSSAWIKSPVRRSCELVIVGWWPPTGPTRSGRVGSLLLAGRREDGQLVLVGQVGSGFSDTERRRLYSLLDGLAQEAPPVPDAPAIGGVTWVRPRYVGEVAFRSTTAPEDCGMPPGKDCARSGLPMSACPTNCNRESATTR